MKTSPYINCKFISAISVDRTHKWNNKLVKGDREAIGLTENASVLLQRMVAEQEIAKMKKVYGETLNTEK